MYKQINQDYSCLCGCGSNCRCDKNCVCACNQYNPSKNYRRLVAYNQPTAYMALNQPTTYLAQNQPTAYRTSNQPAAYVLPRRSGQTIPVTTTTMTQSQKPTACRKLSDNLCKMSEASFKIFDENATILPGIGLPSQNKGVCTIIHGMGPGAHNLKINGLESQSPLANAALFSSECADGKYMNLYEMMLPEGISKTPGNESNAEKYAKELNQLGINVAGTHWHWWASDPYVVAIHHQNIGMNPVVFVDKTVKALMNYRDRMNSGNYGTLNS